MTKLAENSNRTCEAQPKVPLQVRVGKQDCPSRHSWRNKTGRVVWGLVYLTLFRPSPRILHGWRRQLLRLFGAHIGTHARIDPSVRIWAPWNLSVGQEASLGARVDCYCVDCIEIGEHATVSQDAMLCTASHDVSDPHMGLITAPILVAPQAWVCARAFVAAGVTIAEGAVVGAQSVVTRDVAEWTIVAGSPARVINHRVLVPQSPD